MQYFLLILGLVMVVKSADILIDSASKIAKRFGISTFIIGITVVAFGTSAPELAVGIMSSVSKANQLTLGNIIGSGISNVAWIVGLTSIIMPITVQKNVIRREVPMLLAIEVALALMLFLNGELSRINGAILVVGFIGFVVYTVICSKNAIKSQLLPQMEADEAKQAAISEFRQSTEAQQTNEGTAQEIAQEAIQETTYEQTIQEIAQEATLHEAQEIAQEATQHEAQETAQDIACEEAVNEEVTVEQIEASENKKIKKASEKKQLAKLWIFAIVSLVGLFIGGRLTVDSSSKIAASFGLSETLIGLTVVAFATTLPELMASLMAVIKKEPDIILGNCIGSNIFNILLVLGASSLISPIAVDNTLWIDMTVFFAVTVLLFVILLIKKSVRRPVGIFLLLTYVSYIAYNILSVTVL